MVDFVRCLVEALCDSANDYIEDDMYILDVADADGNLVKDNPLVLDLNLTLPRWTPVIVFQLLDEESLVDGTVAKKEGEGTNDTEGPAEDRCQETPGTEEAAEDAYEVMVREEEAEEHNTWVTAVRQLMRKGEYRWWRWAWK